MSRRFEAHTSKSRLLGCFAHLLLQLFLLFLPSVTVIMSEVLGRDQKGLCHTVCHLTRQSRYQLIHEIVPYTKEPVVFQRDHGWAGDGPVANALWLSEFNNGRSKFIKVESPSDYKLRPGLRDQEGNEWFAFSMFHQLHCLVRWFPIIFPLSSGVD